MRYEVTLPHLGDIAEQPSSAPEMHSAPLVEVDAKISSVQDNATEVGDAFEKVSLVQGKVAELGDALRMLAATEHELALIPKISASLGSLDLLSARCKEIENDMRYKATLPHFGDIAEQPASADLYDSQSIHSSAFDHLDTKPELPSASLASLVEVDKKISSVQDKAAVFGDAIGKRSLVQGKVTELDDASRMHADTEHGLASIPK